MLDHLGFNITDIKRSRSFYDRTLAPLKIAVVMEITPEQTGGPTHLGYGKTTDSGDIQAGKPSFWFSDQPGTGNRIHVAFVAETRAAVDAFHAAGLSAGGTDNGAPGLRPLYHPNYYGAFVLDPDGHNIEAVCHRPVQAAIRRPEGS